MLPRKNRITRKEFPSHTVRGFRVFSPLFSMVVYQTTEAQSKVAIVVSKKTAKTAVARNRIRRRFYELVQPFLGRLSKNAVIVVYPKKEAEKTPFSALSADVKEALRQARLF